MLENGERKEMRRQDMQCNELSECRYEEKITPEYVWPKKITKTGFKCLYFTRSIEADSENDNIFTFDTNACRIKDKYC